MNQYPVKYNQALYYPSYRQQNSRAVQDFKTVVAYGTLGLGTATGLFFLMRHFLQNAKVKNVESHSTEEGNPATFAKQLKMAFDNDNWFGWGTNEPTVFQTMIDIPSKAAYSKVQSAYYTLYGTSLNADLAGELSSDEYTQVIQILSAKPEK
jgi:hypothetical protein